MRMELQDLPEIEYLSGRAVRKVSPKRIHAIVQVASSVILKRCAGHRGAVGTEWRFHLRPGTSLVPDVAFVSFERLRVLTDEQADEPPFAPDVAVEVRSPSRRPALAEEKIRYYLAHGSKLVLDVDPAERVIHAHGVDGVRTFSGGERFAFDAVSWLQFDVDELFANIEIPR